MWSVLKSNIPSEDKYDLAISFDEVLGLRLAKVQEVKFQVPKDIKRMLEERENLRKLGNFAKADEIREKIESEGYKIEDSLKGMKLKKLA